MDNNTAQNTGIQYPDLGQNAPNTGNVNTVTDLSGISIPDPSQTIPSLTSNVPAASSPSTSPAPSDGTIVQPNPTITPDQGLPTLNVAPPEPQTNLDNIQEAVPINDPNDKRELKGAVENELQDIIPGEKLPKALKREPKANNLAQPIDEVESAPVVKQNTAKIDELLRYAIQHNASDLHITAGYPPIVRIDGQLKEISEKVLTEEETEELILPVLSDEKKELLEVNREVDLAYFHEGEYSARFRINAYYTMKSMAAAFRLIPSKIRTIDELYLPQIYHRFAQLQQGFILVTGPTGHGKSTTLAAILEEINRNRFVHIVTIEDPIEYVFEGKKSLIDQREMNDDTHSWPMALRSALRQDPDVILVGEMRDYETIASAITLAETGHLVFATLHTNNAAQTVDRIIDVFPENQQAQIRLQLANILEAIVAQRLIPLDKGGRRAVCEIMIANPAVRNMVREAKTHQIDNVIRTSADIGMVTLEKSLVELVREGVISVEKAQEYAVYPEEVLRLLKS
jgi:twitching motility protein PilT